MPSYAQFDVWQNTAGATYNSVVQVTHYVLRNQRFGVSSTEAKFMESSITTKLANSRIMVEIMAPHGAYNQDVDIAAAVGYGTSSSGSTSAYTSLHGSYSRQTVSNLGSYFAQDTSEPGGGSWNGGYVVVPRFYQTVHSPGYAAGTTIYYSVWASTESGTMYWGSAYSGSTDNGQDCTITLTELSQ